MNRYENPAEPPPPKPSLTVRLLAPFAPALATVLASALLGGMRGVDGADRTVRAAALLPIAGLGMDLYTVVVARWLRRRGGVVAIPLAAPILFGAVRMLLHGFCRAQLAAPGSPALIGVLGLVSLAFTVYEGVMVRMALCPSAERLRRAEAPPADVPVGPEYAYEAQTILLALGYYRGAVDGELSAGVRAAVRAFQEEVGLMAHGGLTAATVIELRKRWEAHQARAIQRPTEGAERRNGRGVWTRVQEWFR